MKLSGHGLEVEFPSVHVSGVIGLAGGAVYFLGNWLKENTETLCLAIREVPSSAERISTLLTNECLNRNPEALLIMGFGAILFAGGSLSVFVNLYRALTRNPSEGNEL